MNIIFFFIILFLIFNYINKNTPNNEYKFVNILDKYNKYSIINSSIDVNTINKIKSTVVKIHNDTENYKYNYDILDYLINDIENIFIDKNKISLLSDFDNNIIQNFINDCKKLLVICKNNLNNTNELNIHKSPIYINNIKEYNKNIYI